MKEPRFAIRGTKLRTVFWDDQPTEMVIPEGVTEIESFGHLRAGRIQIYLPDGITTMKSFSTEWKTDEPRMVLMVRPGTRTEATVRRGGWPYELIEVGDPGETLPAPPEFEMRGTTLTAYTGREEDVTIPEGVTDVGMFAFFGNRALKRVSFPEGLTTIHAAAFAGCGRLDAVRLPESLRAIRSYAFAGCRLSGEPIHLPEDCAEVGPHCFTSFTTVFDRIPGGLIPGIGWMAFSCCGVTGRLEVPDGVERIPDGAFSHCVLRGGVRLPASLQAIGREAFYCSGLKVIDLPDGLEELGDNALYGNPVSALVLPDSLRGRLSLWLENVRTLDIPPGVSELHLSLNKVEKLTIPQGVCTVELCLPKARHLVIPEGVELATVSNSPLLESLDLPDSLRGTVSFDNCNSLKYLRIPEGVTTLRNDCFNECHALERVELPASLTTIEPCAFIHENGSKVKAVVAAPEGSYALEYAQEKGLNWETL